MANPVVELEGVRREYLVGDQVTVALDGIDLVIEHGEFVAIVGPSGSGKSTMMNLIGCLDRPSSGVVKIAGDSTGESVFVIRNRFRSRPGRLIGSLILR